MEIEKELAGIKDAVEYNRKLLTELTLTLSANQESKQMLSAQMGVLKTMFSNLPGMPPELKKGLDDIFDRAGGQ